MWSFNPELKSNSILIKEFFFFLQRLILKFRCLSIKYTWLLYISQFYSLKPCLIPAAKQSPWVPAKSILRVLCLGSWVLKPSFISELLSCLLCPLPWDSAPLQWSLFYLVLGHPDGDHLPGCAHISSFQTLHHNDLLPTHWGNTCYPFLDLADTVCLSSLPHITCHQNSWIIYPSISLNLRSIRSSGEILNTTASCWKGMDTCICRTHYFAVHLKLTQLYKSTILQ